VGFHRLTVATQEFVFGTEDAKLQYAGILDILELIEHEGLGWGYQLFFSDGTAIRHPKVDFAWLTRAGPLIVSLAREIAVRPSRHSVGVSTREVPRSNRVLVRQTLSLLRREQLSKVLESHPTGVIKLAGRAYWPRVVIARKRQRSFDTVGNQRATHLLLLAQTLASRLRRERGLPPGARQVLNELGTAVGQCLSLFPFVHLKSAYFRLPDRPVREECIDDRYRTMFRLWEELTKERCWEPGLEAAPHFAYVTYADQIYQAFVACLIAQGLGAPRMGRSLMPGLKRPAFRSARFELYYDTVPPRPEFVSWRDDSSRPADLTPDVTVIDREHRRGMLIEAKYRSDDAGNLPGEAILEAQVYMQSFGRKAIAVCYPGRTPAIDKITGSGNTVLAVSLAPFADVASYVRDVVRPALEAVMEPLGC